MGLRRGEDTVTTTNISETRNKVKSLIALFPGLHLRGLQRAIGLSFNSTRYHVFKLCNSGEIQGVKDQNRMRLYPPGLKPADLELFSMLRRKVPRTILSRAVDIEGSFSQRQICEMTGLAKSTVSESLNELISTGIIKKNMFEKSRCSYQLENRDALKPLLNEVSESDHMIAQRFVDLWDF